MTKLPSGIVMVLALATVALQQRTPEISREDMEWLNQVSDRAYDALMPIDVPGLRAVYRTGTYFRLDEIERYFAITLSKAPSGLVATVVIPADKGIRRQLLDLHQRDYKASFESILVRVSVRRLLVDAAACRAIQSQMTVLSGLNVSLNDTRQVFLDATRHRIAVWFSAGKIDVTLFDEGFPLARWATDTYEALVACGRAE